jgi:DNA-binding CsgD family transcriptional regulator
MDRKRLMRSGIDPIGELTWGAHICLFYQTRQDLIDTHADYFTAGLAEGEFCIWATSDPLSVDEAIEGLRGAIPEFDRHLADGAIELTPGYKWYLRGADFDPKRIIEGWLAKLAEAEARGFTGMRVSGNAFWIEGDVWPMFHAYEEELERALEGQKMIALCTYPLHAASSVDVLDVARAHGFSIARRDGRWEFLQTPELVEVTDGFRRPRGPIDILSEPFAGQDLLTARERVVLAQILKGALTKEAARSLGISPRTVEYHRANIMKKLGARNVADLVTKVHSR